MGYEVERVVGTVNEGLLCSICRDVLEEPLQAPCEHAFCSACIHGWLAHESTCPEDRISLCQTHLSPLHRYMKNDLARLRLQCRNSAEGCDAVMGIDGLQSHDAECDYGLVSCPCLGCHRVLRKAALSQHLENCEFCTRECRKGCGMLLVGDVDRDHNCISELRASVELLRSEMVCRIEEQRRETALSLQIQREQSVQRERRQQATITCLRAELDRINRQLLCIMDCFTGKLKIDGSTMSTSSQENLKSSSSKWHRQERETTL